MAELYNRLNELGQIHGGGNPVKVYAGAHTNAATSNTITIPGINNLLSCVASGDDLATYPDVTVASNVPTIVAGANDVIQVVIFYN